MSVILVFAIASASVIVQGSVVKFENCTILGRSRVTNKLFKYYSYEGIPYAEPPIGDLRFKDPLPAKLQGVYDARQLGPDCLASFTEVAPIVSGSEDCLYLNIYVPRNLTKSQYGIPVIAYIHSGAFGAGSSTKLSPELFIENGNIYVSFAYRLGPLGFLCLHTADVPGNAGMKDQVLALKWIKQYIYYFGGDPNNISIFGDSSGAMSAQLHQISPMTRGLMNKIMTFSGSSLCETMIQRFPLNKTSQMATLLGLVLNDTFFLRNLQAKSAVDIVKASYYLKMEVGGFENIKDLIFSPVIEQIHNGVEAFINRDPIEYYRSGNYTHVPILIGQTSQEYAVNTIKAGKYRTKLLFTNPRVIVPNNWQTVLSSSGIQIVNNLILNFYFGTTTANLSNHDHLVSGIKLISDLWMIIATNKLVRELALTSLAPIYYYEFSFTGVLNGPSVLPLGIVGASHGDERFFLSSAENPRIGEYTPDGWTRQRLVAIYENMIRTGNPTPGPYSNVLPIKWLPVTKDTLNYVEIHGDLTTSSNPNTRTMNFWTDLEKRVFNGEFN